MLKRYLLPDADWPAPENVKACVTYRSRDLEHPGGGSNTISYNMSWSSGEKESVVENRSLLAEDWQWRTQPQWLKEVHGIEVVEAQPDNVEREGDAVWTDRHGLPCAILTADCLPVIFCDVNGRKVAAAHAGWRGMVRGVLEETVRKIGVAPEHLLAWFGPAISQPHYEVGPEVRDAFMNVDQKAEAAFIPGNSDRYYCDLYALARMRLDRVGVKQVYGGGLCTYSDPAHWFSYRRDGARKGCLATVVWLSENH
jgi:YfiH family protein